MSSTLQLRMRVAMRVGAMRQPAPSFLGAPVRLFQIRQPSIRLPGESAPAFTLTMNGGKSGAWYGLNSELKSAYMSDGAKIR